MALEPINKSTVHYLARKVSIIKIARKPRYRRCIAVGCEDLQIPEGEDDDIPS